MFSDGFHTVHWSCSILTYYADSVDDNNECKSSEEMRAFIEKFNSETLTETKLKCIIFSMDVKALFPSLRIEACMKAVTELIEKSDISEENIDWWEAAKYVAVFYTAKEIEEKGLKSVIPTRTKVSKRPLTINCLSVDSSKHDDEKWTKAPDTPTPTQKKTIFAMAIAYLCKITLTNYFKNN